MSKKRIIRFDKEHRFLSNFFYVPGGVYSEEDGIIYPTVEHAYQAAKTKDKLAKIFIKQLLTPNEAKQYGRDLELRDDWQLVREDIMKDLILIKFRNNDLRKKLISTEDAELIEGNNWGDAFWGQILKKGSNKPGKGLNKLGKILMEVRDYYKNNKGGDPYEFEREEDQQKQD